MFWLLLVDLLQQPMEWPGLLLPVVGWVDLWSGHGSIAKSTPARRNHVLLTVPGLIFSKNCEEEGQEKNELKIGLLGSEVVAPIGQTRYRRSNGAMHRPRASISLALRFHRLPCGTALFRPDDTGPIVGGRW